MGVNCDKELLEFIGFRAKAGTGDLPLARLHGIGNELFNRVFK